MSRGVLHEEARNWSRKSAADEGVGDRRRKKMEVDRDPEGFWQKVGLSLPC